jgi:hypothetical protein
VWWCGVVWCGVLAGEQKRKKDEKPPLEEREKELRARMAATVNTPPPEVRVAVCCALERN